MKTKHLLLVACMLLSLISCRTKDKTTTINEDLQTICDSLLSARLNELNGLSGQIVVMEVKSGEIKAIAGESQSQPSSLAKGFSLLAVLETGNVKLSDTVDVGEGIYIDSNDTIKDHNWHRGGYGNLSVLEGFIYSSNIACCKSTKKAFANYQDYANMRSAILYGEPKYINGLDSLSDANFCTTDNCSLNYACIGYQQMISPIQTLTFYNAIANDGIMIKPILYKGDAEIIKEQIANNANIDSMQFALSESIKRGLGRVVYDKEICSSGLAATTKIGEVNDENLYRMEFCGYFPSQKPQYTIIVCLDKVGLPASANHSAGKIYKEVVDYIIQMEEENS